MIKRLPEIDALRGVAIVGMVLFHAAFIALIFGLIEFEPYGWPLIVPVRAVQFLFLGLMGVSVHLSSRGFGGQLERAGILAGAAALVSLGTALFFPEEFVRFGVLHFAMVAIPVVSLFKGRPALALWTAAGSFLLGEFFLSFRVESEWLFPFGLLNSGFTSLDYFPLFPWLAAPLVGLVIGEAVYKKREPTALEALAGIPGLAALGRHSLAIYLLHPPVLFVTLWALSLLLK